MTGPKRIQMSRQHPWRAENPDAVRVDRGSDFGNPYRVVRMPCPSRHVCWTVQIGDAILNTHLTKQHALDVAVDLFDRWVHRTAQFNLRVRMRQELRGNDLACWCKLTSKCHADIVMGIANG